MRLILSLIVIAVGWGAPALACSAQSDCMLGTRSYRIALPEGYDPQHPVGAIVFAHGYRGSAAGVMRNISLRRVASDMGLALIAADADGDGWILPHAPRHPEATGAVEFDYFTALVRDATSRFAIDGDRMMMTGFSAGGMMAWALACARPGLFAGFAPISGTYWRAPPADCAAPAASIVHIHGDDDPVVPLAGRPIGPTRQGDVAQSLAMYRGFGDFGAARATTSGDLRCDIRNNAPGDVLEFCLFAGGHSFRSEFVRFAWGRFRAAGQL
ncbi:alpha/beta hydrolase family esterase [Sulfitobacter sabulilitoris]|uniref:Polyhydroxybutyrate depolymerase n=1 Tax=Sulfitobacter sabulilitoris TaxID=2562655 RepID=A0A5S3PDU8_9RHOB|nr:prolyl oligopeptidase family serine peptidase [Sulfitobacter sabulilitoris]TMM51129.1 polyhydroxybutyrate depolymerase [Sulfitobacter sabulilitoris]